MIFARARKLREAGVIGINARNSRYIAPHNPRVLYALVDDKIRTKRLAQAAGIAVPELYGLIHSVGESENLEDVIRDHKEFVIKPAHGSGGNGILVIAGRRKNAFYKTDGTIIDIYTLRHHIENVLGGVYSLGGHPDQAIIEYRVRFNPVFNEISYQGVPDIRVMLYRGIPTMAMLRLPTKRSGGRANLHQGAVGVGIALATGLTTLSVCDNQRIIEHPDFGHLLAGLQIPGWEDLLLLATRCYELAPLGYLGVDIVLDANLGPLILEMNARPGLSIQIANGLGLQPRLDAIDVYYEQSGISTGAVERAQLARTFGF